MFTFIILAASTSRPLTDQAMTGTEMFIRIILAVLTMLVGMAVGLLLRRWLIGRLKKTVLDDWLSGILGFIIILPPLVIALAGAFDIFTNRWDWPLTFWQSITTGVKPMDLRDTTLKLIGS